MRETVSIYLCLTFLISFIGIVKADKEHERVVALLFCLAQALTFYYIYTLGGVGIKP